MAGIFGVVSKKESCSEQLFYGVDYHSHLGTDFAGLAVFGSNGIERKIHDIRGENFRPKFQQAYRGMKGRYGVGVIGYDIQPIVLSSRLGVFAIVINGNISNLDELMKELQAEGTNFAEIQADGSISPAEVIGELVTRGKTLEAGMEMAFKRIQGAVSMLILTKDAVYAARDRMGYSPLTVGEGEEGFAVTTETTAFPNLGYKTIAELIPGEIVRITEAGIERRREGNSAVDRPCAFLWIYTGFPASTIEGINVEEARYRSGANLAKRDKAAGFEADLVAGVPDSGVGHAVGYANESGIPYGRPIVKYTPSWPRSYMPSEQSTRDLIANMKIIAIPSLIKGKRIVICDDSIVRGTQLRKLITAKLLAHGAKEVHIRIACPPLMFPCAYNQSTRTTKELAARRAIRILEGEDIQDVREYLDPDSAKYAAMVDIITKELGAASLKYQRLDEMAAAIGRPANRICKFCWTGQS